MTFAPLERAVAERLARGEDPHGVQFRSVVSAALRRLRRKGLADWGPGGRWYLTDAGRAALALEMK